MMDVVAVYDIKGVCKINTPRGCLWAGVRLRDKYNEIRISQFDHNACSFLFNVLI